MLHSRRLTSTLIAAWLCGQSWGCSSGGESHVDGGDTAADRADSADSDGSIDLPRVDSAPPDAPEDLTADVLVADASTPTDVDSALPDAPEDLTADVLVADASTPTDVAVDAKQDSSGVDASSSQTFVYTGVEQLFTVPPGATVLQLQLSGAQGAAGGAGRAGAGGLGAVVACTIAVTPGEVLQIRVGGRGVGRLGGFNGGGDGGSQSGGEAGDGGGGGGATDVRRAPYGLGDRVCIAGGGGGGGGSAGATWYGGPGGGGALDGEAGGPDETAVIYPSNCIADINVFPWVYESCGAGGGNGGTQLAGGQAGPALPSATPGASGLGGTGATTDSTDAVGCGGGGGGGGGTFGGGGGGGSKFSRSGGGGGGGGSSLLSGSAPAIDPAARVGDGLAVVSW